VVIGSQFGWGTNPKRQEFVDYRRSAAASRMAESHGVDTEKARLTAGFLNGVSSPVGSGNVADEGGAAADQDNGQKGEKSDLVGSVGHRGTPLSHLVVGSV